MSSSVITRPARDVARFAVSLGMLLSIAACGPSLKLKPIDLNADPVVQMRLLKESLDTARKEDVPVFAPTWFARADKSYSELLELDKKGRDNNTLLAMISRAQAELSEAKQIAEVGRAELSVPYRARKQAIAAGAPELFPGDFESMEKRLRDLSEDVEKDNLGSVRKGVKQVTAGYLKLELRAIKGHTLGEARRLISSAIEGGAKRLTPRTLQEAEDSLRQTDAFITANPHASEQIQIRAETTLYHARHLDYLLQQARLWESRSIEDRLRDIEGRLVTIQGLIAGTEGTQRVQYIDDYFKDIEQGMRAMLDNQEFLNTELARVRQQRRQDMVESLQRETGFQQKIQRLSDEERQFRAQIAEQQAQRELDQELAARFERVREMFGDSEAEVYRQGSELLIRLKGLYFEIGKSYVLPDHYPLLTKVLKSIRTFDTQSVVVEGHTDSTGSQGGNQQLSLERAEAVRSYFVMHGGLQPEQIKAVGFGPAKPIAPNNSADGRRLNRRIDVIMAVR